MKPASELMTVAEYARILRPLLPPGAFAPNHRHLYRISAHMVLIIAGYCILRHLPIWWVAPLCTLLIGHSLACLAFIAHDVSHSSVITHRTGKRLLEMLLWGLNYIPPTLWRRLHNQSHHVSANTAADPDRCFVVAERNLATQVYVRTFTPSKSYPKHSPVIWCQFTAYIIRNLVAAFVPSDTKPFVVPFKPRYSAAQRAMIFLELLVIGTLQCGVFVLVGSDWRRFLMASPLAVLVTSGVATMYIFTNHFANPLCEHHDPLVGSTSVIVPPLVDWLHDNFSYHTEHHVFPSMNPRYFPLVSKLLQEYFPERYNRIPMREAWRRLWSKDEFLAETFPSS